MRTQYTDDYPDVVAEKRLIAHLQSELADKSNNGDAIDTQGISNPAYVMLMSKLADMETEVAVDHERLADAQKTSRRCEENGSRKRSRSSASMKISIAIIRCYTTITKNWSRAAKSAKITQAAGDQQSSFVFRVVSPPRKPDRPIAPNRLLVECGGSTCLVSAARRRSCVLSRPVLRQVPDAWSN